MGAAETVAQRKGGAVKSRPEDPQHMFQDARGFCKSKG